MFFCSGLTAISTYLLTKELWSSGAGLLAACFIAIVPGYISRSVAGSYDNEGIAIFALQFTYYLWVKSVKTGSIFWATMTALSYFYMVCIYFGNNFQSKKNLTYFPVNFYLAYFPVNLLTKLGIAHKYNMRLRNTIKHDVYLTLTKNNQKFG